MNRAEEKLVCPACGKHQRIAATYACLSKDCTAKLWRGEPRKAGWPVTHPCRKCDADMLHVHYHCTDCTPDRTMLVNKLVARYSQAAKKLRRMK